MQSSGEDIDSQYSPSFNIYFNANLTEVVARVTSQLSADSDDDFRSNNGNRDEYGGDTGIGYENGNGDDFEFNLSNLAPAGGDFRPVYPVFDSDLTRDFDLVGEIESRQSDREVEHTTAPIQLKNLFLEDHDGDPPSSSSSSSSSPKEADELEGIPPGTYCVWLPNKSPCASPSPGRCTKSNSTGSSAAAAEKAKAWKLRDLLRRSSSDGKNQGRMMLLTPKKKADAPAGRGGICSVATASSAEAGGKVTRVTAAKTVARGGYTGRRSREAEVKNNRRSYLPYRQDLVGFFVSPRTLRKMHLPS